MSILPALKWAKLSLAVCLAVWLQAQEPQQRRPHIPVHLSTAGKEGGRPPQATAAKNHYSYRSGTTRRESGEKAKHPGGETGGPLAVFTHTFLHFSLTDKTSLLTLR